MHPKNPLSPDQNSEEKTMLDKLRHTAEVAKFKTNQMMKVNKIQGEINQVKQEIDKLRVQIADQVLALRASGVTIPQLEELCSAIDQFNAQIAEKNAQIEMVKAEQAPQPPQCPTCQTFLQPGTTFCPKCGTPIQAAPPPPPPPAAAPLVCSKCGATLPDGTVFCTSCGQKLTP
jgi:RNA polymerase subunit RPABC4/transcription elongation factor Spt4